ncbi:hypothetical protein ACMTN4_14545 [Rhodococcus globerulus]|uniref:hypothetical protein n=1 Tax=Rhodococcus globerulus TaxID=33008 RepID=UPI0039E8D449
MLDYRDEVAEPAGLAHSAQPQSSVYPLNSHTTADVGWKSSGIVPGPATDLLTAPVSALAPGSPRTPCAIAA